MKNSDKNRKHSDKKANIPKRKYWYRDTLVVCVLCGHEDRYRERVYDESKKGLIVEETACWKHF